VFFYATVLPHLWTSALTAWEFEAGSKDFMKLMSKYRFEKGVIRPKEKKEENTIPCSFSGKICRI